MNHNVSFFAGPVANERSGKSIFFGQKQKTGAGVGIAAALRGENDPIAQKRAQAQKRVRKIITDASSSDFKIDDDMRARESRIKEYEKALKEANSQIKSINDREEELRLEYGVSEDSQEQKDLDALKEYYETQRKRGMMDPERAQELIEQGDYTEYQKLVLIADQSKAPFEAAIEESQKGIRQECETINAMKLERLKHHGMVDANKQAEEVMAAASDEIMGMLLDEAKEHIDEKQEEETEKAEEKKEEEKEEEEKIEAAKERREEMEELADPEHAQKEERHETETDSLAEDPLTAALLNMDKKSNDIKQEVNQIMMEMKLVVEDVKGVTVDTSL